MLGAVLAGGAVLGAGLNALGAGRANSENEDLQRDIDRARNKILRIAVPLRKELETGLSLGGRLREANYANAAIPVQTQLGQAQTALRAGAWRYGGAGSGLNQRRWTDAARTADQQLLGARMSADTNALDTLGRIDTLRRGYSDSFNPQSIAQNQYAWVPQLLNTGLQTYTSATGGRVF